MRNVKVGRTVNASQSVVWEVLADYPNIADWNDGVSKSYGLGEQAEGVGAQRRCELAPNGKMQMSETVAEWLPVERMVIDIGEIEKMPIKSATMTFTLSGDGDGTHVAMSYDYEPKGGPLGMIYGPVMDKQMQKGFGGFIDSLEREARVRAAN